MRAPATEPKLPKIAAVIVPLAIVGTELLINLLIHPELHSVPNDRFMTQVMIVFSVSNPRVGRAIGGRLQDYLLASSVSAAIYFALAIPLHQAVPYLFLSLALCLLGVLFFPFKRLGVRTKRAAKTAANR